MSPGTVVKPALMAVLEKYRDEEQAERDKKKKEQETSKTPPASAEISQGPLLLHNSKSKTIFISSVIVLLHCWTGATSLSLLMIIKEDFLY